jgi:hypothetical protein
MCLCLWLEDDDCGGCEVGGKAERAEMVSEERMEEEDKHRLW